MRTCPSPIGMCASAIARLSALGYVIQHRDGKDGRAIDLRLSAKGAKAMQASSVLESARVKRMLTQLSVTDRKRALEGLALLGKAARVSNGDRE